MAQIANQLVTAVVRALRHAGMDAFADSQVICPVKTGTLKRSGYRKNIDGGIEYGYTARHAAAVEDGVTDHDELIPAHTRKEHLRRVAGRKRRTRVKAHSVRSYTRHVKARPGTHFVRSTLQPYLNQLPRSIADNIRMIKP